MLGAAASKGVWGHEEKHSLTGGDRRRRVRDRGVGRRFRAASAARAGTGRPFASKYPPVVAQFGPTTGYSTIVCPNWAKAPDGSWNALNPTPYSLGFVQGIIPPVRPVLVGGYIYNNIDLYSQLELQCGAALVRARY